MTGVVTGHCFWCLVVCGGFACPQRGGGTVVVFCCVVLLKMLEKERVVTQRRQSRYKSSARYWILYPVMQCCIRRL